MKRQIWKCAFRLMCLITVFGVSNTVEARTWYNFPTYSKVKIAQNPDGQWWIYVEFMWGEEGVPEAQQKVKPNFEKGKAVEFEIGITPKCFLQPQVGKDKKFVFNDLVSLK